MFVHHVVIVQIAGGFVEGRVRKGRGEFTGPRLLSVVHDGYSLPTTGVVLWKFRLYHGGIFIFYFGFPLALDKTCAIGDFYL